MSISTYSTEKKGKQLVETGKVSEGQLKKIEKNTLDSLYAYDKNEMTVNKVLKNLLVYNKLFSVPDSITKNYFRTLNDNPGKNVTVKYVKKLESMLLFLRK